MIPDELQVSKGFRGERCMNSQLLLHRTLLSGCEVKLPIYLPKHLVRSLISEHLCFGNAKSFWQQPGLLPEQWVLRFVRSQRLLGDPKFKSDWCKNKETSGPPRSGSFKFAQNSFRSDSFLSTYPVFSCQVWSLLVGQPVSEKLRVDLSDTMCSRSGQPR